MNIWIIFSVIFLIISAIACACWAKAARERDVNAARLDEMNAMRSELDRVRADDYQHRRRINMLSDALEDEQAYSGELEAALADREKRLIEQNKRIDQANALRTRAEKDASGSLLKAQLYERQYERLRDEHRQLERLYREKSEECRALLAQPAEKAQKRKNQKTEILDQISMSDLFDL